ncbi:hypothetical protein SODALDRAFT_135914 [Sodiomyces alkalinus F11]|uniref:Uncharacterized protein n=1 Tax=Sodiomyces alkalinus (strain CBS 110278 / VKM F-3762 / F11) TaxID=1314773 RepID=A0A3N2PYX5_SODAK|nr:hypothetical protein SODALDRAFT_135914 [Sodiomyces alkalinus F11]ROT39697.1 hypothetical protein SODALDRAFT_135914 [Sodiomyces alkalinus F11]
MFPLFLGPCSYSFSSRLFLIPTCTLDCLPPALPLFVTWGALGLSHNHLTTPERARARARGRGRGRSQIVSKTLDAPRLGISRFDERPRIPDAGPFEPHARRSRTHPPGARSRTGED